MKVNLDQDQSETLKTIENFFSFLCHKNGTSLQLRSWNEEDTQSGATTILQHLQQWLKREMKLWEMTHLRPPESRLLRGEEEEEEREQLLGDSQIYFFVTR